MEKYKKGFFLGVNQEILFIKLIFIHFDLEGYEMSENERRGERSQE